MNKCDTPAGLFACRPLPIEPEIQATLLTGGIDRPYVFGLTMSLASKAVSLDLVGSDELTCEELCTHRRVRFLNLRGSQRPDASLAGKISRVSLYYAKLIGYSFRAKPSIFHILWNNRFETVDRTFLMSYYKLLGKKLVITAHNVNAAKRDCNDSSLNRLTLRIQYRLSDHIFVHTASMKRELTAQFGVNADRVTVIPFGINNAVPNTCLTSEEAKSRLGLRNSDRTILFFGRITPYKGLEYLVSAFRRLAGQGDDYRLLIAGQPDKCDEYWATVRRDILGEVQSGLILLRPEFIPDDQTEIYFKAADLLVLPYKDVYQSGVLFLGHAFGLPVIAADVGSLKDDIVENMTGLLFKAQDPVDLAMGIERYFNSELYANLASRRRDIQEFAKGRHSWDVVAQSIRRVYADLLQSQLPNAANRDLSG